MVLILRSALLRASRRMKARALALRDAASLREIPGLASRARNNGEDYSAPLASRFITSSS